MRVIRSEISDPQVKTILALRTMSCELKKFLYICANFFCNSWECILTASSERRVLPLRLSDNSRLSLSIRPNIYRILFYNIMKFHTHSKFLYMNLSDNICRVFVFLFFRLFSILDWDLSKFVHLSLIFLYNFYALMMNVSVIAAIGSLYHNSSYSRSHSTLCEWLIIASTENITGILTTLKDFYTIDLIYREIKER